MGHHVGAEMICSDAFLYNQYHLQRKRLQIVQPMSKKLILFNYVHVKKCVIYLLTCFLFSNRNSAQRLRPGFGYRPVSCIVYTIEFKKDTTSSCPFIRFWQQRRSFTVLPFNAPTKYIFHKLRLRQSFYNSCMALQLILQKNSQYNHLAPD